MQEQQKFGYFIGEEASQYTFFQIPYLLFANPCFKCLSNDAKLLYGLLLDRMGLSEYNGWYDEQGRVYIYYTVEEVRQDLNCGNDKAMKTLAELDSAKGVGLIERVKQGQGKPSKIYVKRFTIQTMPPEEQELPTPPAPPMAGIGYSERRTRFFPRREVEKVEVMTPKNRNVIKLIQIKLILSILIHPSPGGPAGRDDGSIRAKRRSAGADRLCRAETQPPLRRSG